MNGVMRIGILALILVALAVAVGMAQTKYVSEDFEITMRTGPGNDRKIIAMVPSGREVEVVEAGDEWSLVRLPSGKEGWVLSRYLTSELPTPMKLQRLETRYNSLQEQNKSLQEKLAETSSDSSSLGAELKQTQQQLKSVETAHEALKRDSADFIKFKATYEKNLKELNEIRTKADQLESDLKKLASSQLIEGILYGGGLVIIAFIAGWVMKKPKRRAGLL